MTLVRRRITHIAGSGHQHVPPDERQWRIQLLQDRHPGHRSTPHCLAIGDRDLGDLAVRGCRIDVLPVGVRDRCRIGDLLDDQTPRASRDSRRGSDFIEAGGRVFPQHLAIVGVDRHGPAHIGGAEENVVRCAVDLDAAQIDESGIDGRGNRHLLAHHGAHVSRGNLRRRHVGIGSRIAAAEGRPVARSGANDRIRITHSGRIRLLGQPGTTARGCYGAGQKCLVDHSHALSP